MTDEATKERARMALEDAALFALEAGFTADEIVAEVKYAVETADS